MSGVSIHVTVDSRFASIRDKARGLAGIYTAKAARQVEEIARANVPVDTGALQAGINAVQMGVLHWRVIASSMDGGADREYANFVEEGTSKMDPQPYLQPALDDVELDYFTDMARIAE